MDAIKCEPELDRGDDDPLNWLEIDLKQGSTVLKTELEEHIEDATTWDVVKCEYESDPEYDDELRRISSEEPRRAKTEPAERGDEIMDDVLPTTTLGALANWEPPPDEEEFFRNIIKTLDRFYPENWRSWVVNDVSYEDLFGKTISSDEENRLRFAIPTVHLALAFKTTFSEGKYKLIKQILIRWPLGRALIYSPLATMKRIHPTGASCGFSQNIPAIKQHLISRVQAVKIMKAQSETPSTSSRSVASTSQSQSRKRPLSPEPSTSQLHSFMKRQNDVIEQLLSISKLTTEIITKNKTASDDPENMEESDSEGDVTDDWIAPSWTPEPSPEVEESPNLPEEEFFNFIPETKESEAEIGIADEAIVKQGIQCQRLGQASWRDIPYADVQKQFEAYPVFTNLQINSHLATVTPNWEVIRILEKADACLGAITHGLLKQRKIFQETYNKMPSEVKYYIRKHLLSAESPFRKISQNLLQYTCGRRAEVIQQRRSIYKPPNRRLHELLHAIPPSETHLFSEPQLSDLIKEVGGINKLFPCRRQTQPNTSFTSNTQRRDKRRNSERQNTNKAKEQSSRKRDIGKSKKPKLDG